MQRWASSCEIQAGTRDPSRLAPTPAVVPVAATIHGKPGRARRTLLLWGRRVPQYGLMPCARFAGGAGGEDILLFAVAVELEAEGVVGLLIALALANKYTSQVPQDQAQRS